MAVEHEVVRRTEAVSVDVRVEPRHFASQQVYALDATAGEALWLVTGQVPVPRCDIRVLAPAVVADVRGPVRADRHAVHPATTVRQEFLGAVGQHPREVAVDDLADEQRAVRQGNRPLGELQAGGDKTRIHERDSSTVVGVAPSAGSSGRDRSGSDTRCAANAHSAAAHATATNVVRTPYSP